MELRCTSCRAEEEAAAVADNIDDDHILFMVNGHGGSGSGSGRYLEIEVLVWKFDMYGMYVVDNICHT